MNRANQPSRPAPTLVDVTDLVDTMEKYAAMGPSASGNLAALNLVAYLRRAAGRAIPEAEEGDPMNRAMLCEEIERLRHIVGLASINGSASGLTWTVKVRSHLDPHAYGEGAAFNPNEAMYAAMLDLGKKLRIAPTLLERKP